MRASTANQGLNLMGWLVRTSWGRRLDTGLTLAATVARVGLVAFLGPNAGALTVALLGVFLFAYRPSRLWMVDLYRRERLERLYGKVFDAVGLRTDVAPAVVRQWGTPSGSVIDIVVTPRCTTTDLSKLAEPLAVALGVARVRVQGDRAMARRAQLVLISRDPLAEVPVPWPWAGVERSNLWSGVPLGYDEDNTLVTLELAGHHLLLGGEPGAGKSNALSLVVASAAMDPDSQLWCFDGKLVELAAWKRSARRFVGADIEKATVVLEELQAEMEERYTLLLEAGLRKVDQTTGVGLIVVVIDELALYTQGKGKARDQFVELLRDVVARGRAAGIVVVAATQKPASDIVPTSIRDLFGCRLALRCSTKDASDTVLGAGWATEGYSASEFDPAHRGVGYLLAEGNVPTRMRCFMLEDAPLANLARRAERLRGTDQ
jgi:hypothetical protein